MKMAAEKKKQDLKEMEAAILKIYKGWDHDALIEVTRFLVENRVTIADAHSGFDLITPEMARNWQIDDLSYAKLRMKAVRNAAGYVVCRLS